MTPNPEAAFTCLAVAVFAVLTIPVVLFADDTVTTYRPAWADRLSLRPLRHLPATLRRVSLTTAALYLICLGGTTHVR